MATLRFAVQPGLAFQLSNGMPQQFRLVFVQLQGLLDQPVALHQFGGGKPQRQPGTLGMVLNQMGDGVDAAVHGAVFAVGSITKINAARRFAVAGHMQSMLDQLVDALVFGGGDGHHRYTQQFFQLVDHDGASVGAHFIHHVQRQHHRNAQLHQLHG